MTYNAIVIVQLFRARYEANVSNHKEIEGKLRCSSKKHGQSHTLQWQQHLSFHLSLLCYRMPSSCKDIRQELVDCMLKSDCVLKKGNSVRECFKEEHADDVPKECHSIRKSFYECRRGMVRYLPDMNNIVNHNI
jgi:cytochrome c oxidase assembly factor 5